ncbi:Lrp/AsnC ligand binding domain-containing protein [Rhodococcus sp. BP-349]|jgi:DNA-binding Lrp family transcriptional regulator|uniref:Lrp/AsnC family transcriptional regulator n=1 Tax=unclassified Rhodococcus (in: high G+C Gram-positive bacteria) TaxID=192944 RepID=UPI00048862A4|nr:MULTISPECIES: Lrp/AsnC ligand binding domain-containing protein [unclassified Rhodococcus (in: high G+C Gram-positive bacteria)]KQU30545.1 AsnC family transcriptional regulator [Rhodococcus sp. Leaf225]KQU44553.1 AsnC family transcriptional regulator [Rhodococcus sp. Leaf258]MBY6540707.1 Lrp/AsnC ligand binding domain-containing protein [Rhodococcus sp. BP-363]MBY6545268.1 Lrp/AsnC ligand binding domain-containing protein [Rhodococcus sp. BP-369]MBY6564498.1 Lrp/AsnC ligand binding domain-c
MITAIVLIHAEVHSIPETARAVADVPGVSEVYSCAGDVDLIAVVKVRTHEEIAEVITERVNRVTGVVRTDTHIAFKSYSSADVDAGFSIGE